MYIIFGLYSLRAYLYLSFFISTNIFSPCEITVRGCREEEFILRTHVHIKETERNVILYICICVCVSVQKKYLKERNVVIDTRGRCREERGAAAAATPSLLSLSRIEGCCM